MHTVLTSTTLITILIIIFTIVTLLTNNKILMLLHNPPPQKKKQKKKNYNTYMITLMPNPNTEPFFNKRTYKQFKNRAHFLLNLSMQLVLTPFV